MDVKKNYSKSQSGQALFEFIIFVPLMLILLSLFMTINSAINASINQQKFTRGFFYHLIQNDSMMPNNSMLANIKGDGAQSASIFALGWQESKQGQTPIAPCFKIKTFFGNPGDEKCTPGEKSLLSTQFIRVKTVYGICGETYNLGSAFGFIPFRHTPSSSPGIMATSLGCMNQ